ncbi:MAG: hypothetical protein K1X89_12025 [Myxococcaceae bacterium]|nr:hypothetical protein [Myxococcaceae bacterium]
MHAPSAAPRAPPPQGTASTLAHRDPIEEVDALLRQNEGLLLARAVSQLELDLAVERLRKQGYLASLYPLGWLEVTNRLLKRIPTHLEHVEGNDGVLDDVHGLLSLSRL